MDHVSRAIQQPRVVVTRLQRYCFRRNYHLRPSFSRVIPPFSHRLGPRAAATTFNADTSNLPNTIPSYRIALRRHASTMADPQFAEGTNPEQARQGLQTLQEQGWVLDEDGQGLKKTFYFKSYFKAVSFVNVVASQSSTKKHHPTMTVRIGSVDIHWTTHHPRGLSEKDLEMAQHCDEAAELMGSVEQGQGKKCSPGRD
ncbi:pterin-4-alpha-carbinolamine dehydratase [Aspergillus eucalypticola CBS 122712]|uniref:4a-hydroxytetrahydrobiopterin dehydratase n=1 Tax=Aspergillus eucalypticola (strain CBS 122712 / IBT 29274) TaxID=1448314 RepID=A0A317UNH6_ASPEC|nr:pterin-4-alpha-carbinolamine dehydratase [Aspergillus eucalypticola CBS 122712]PWY62137.1 pterin-4-alpha-carbinolamine dehydratase [Aspergillus eucalypticola CBS 122712]